MPCCEPRALTTTPRPDSVIRDEDRRGADFHLFSDKDYVWNSKEGDTPALYNPVTKVTLDSASGFWIADLILASDLSSRALSLKEANVKPFSTPQFFVNQVCFMDFQQRGHGPPFCSSMELALPRTFGARPPMRQTVTRTPKTPSDAPMTNCGDQCSCIAKTCDSILELTPRVALRPSEIQAII